MNSSFKIFAFTFISCILASACTNTQIANSEKLETEAEKQAQSSEVSVDEAINMASEKYLKAINDGIKFYAPLHLEKAEDKLEEAQKLAKKVKTPEDKHETISLAFSVNKLVDNAYKNKALVLQQLNNTLTHKDILLEVHSDSIHPKAYQKAVAKLDELIREIEGGNITKAKEMEADTLKYYSELEARTLKTSYLTKAINKLEEADSIDADEYAESTYDKAEAAIKYADNFIKQNYRDREGVKEITTQAFNKAAHAFNVAKEASKLEELDKEQAEQYILNIESFFQRINQQAGIKNLTSLPLHEQSVALAASFEDLKRNGNLSSKETEVEDPQKTNQQSAEELTILDPNPEKNANTE